jgi:hypothetical protein
MKSMRYVGKKLSLLPRGVILAHNTWKRKINRIEHAFHLCNDFLIFELFWRVKVGLQLSPAQFDIFLIVSLEPCLWKVQSLWHCLEIVCDLTHRHVMGFFHKRTP